MRGFRIRISAVGVATGADQDVRADLVTPLNGTMVQEEVFDVTRSDVDQADAGVLDEDIQTSLERQRFPLQDPPEDLKLGILPRPWPAPFVVTPSQLYSIDARSFLLGCGTGSKGNADLPSF